MGPYIVNAAGGWPNAMKKAAASLPNFIWIGMELTIHLMHSGF